MIFCYILSMVLFVWKLTIFITRGEHDKRKNESTDQTEVGRSKNKKGLVSKASNWEFSKNIFLSVKLTWSDNRLTLTRQCQGQFDPLLSRLWLVWGRLTLYQVNYCWFEIDFIYKICLTPTDRWSPLFRTTIFSFKIFYWWKVNNKRINLKIKTIYSLIFKNKNPKPNSY